ncbi:MAG: cytidine deaminase [Bdellovibrionales bacterium]
MPQKKLKKPRPLKQSQFDKLRKMAFQVKNKAHAPYSGFQVGAALLTSDGNFYSGCNVENASYGGTICAERGAVMKAISEGGKPPIEAVFVASSSDQAWPPCGLCLQVLSEFCRATTLIAIFDKNKNEKLYQFSDLLPESFDPSYLKAQT